MNFLSRKGTRAWSSWASARRLCRVFDASTPHAIIALLARRQSYRCSCEISGPEDAETSFSGFARRWRFQQTCRGARGERCGLDIRWEGKGRASATCPVRQCSVTSFSLGPKGESNSPDDVLPVEGPKSSRACGLLRGPPARPIGLVKIEVEKTS